MVILLLILLLILIILILIWLSSRSGASSSEAQFASGWSVKNDADWTPYPPSNNPLGPPDSSCTGGVIAGSWAHFEFPAFGVPAGSSVTGVLARVKYLSQSGTNTVQLTDGGSLVGSAKTLPAVMGESRCSATTFTSVGADGDTWGSSLGASDFASGGVGLRLTQNANTVDIDALELTVFYTT